MKPALSIHANKTLAHKHSDVPKTLDSNRILVILSDLAMTELRTF